MIREYKLDKHKDNSKKNDARKKHHKKAKKNSNHLKQIVNSHTNKKTKKHISISENIQKGGNFKKRDKFEVTTLDNVDCSKFNISQYVNANIDWGLMPGPPPTDCCVM